MQMNLPNGSTTPGISPKELTCNLRQLEQPGLVARTQCRSERPGFEAYALTELGRSLHPAFKALGAFGALLARKCADGVGPDRRGGGRGIPGARGT